MRSDFSSCFDSSSTLLKSLNDRMPAAPFRWQNIYWWSDPSPKNLFPRNNRLLDDHKLMTLSLWHPWHLFKTWVRCCCSGCQEVTLLCGSHSSALLPCCCPAAALLPQISKALLEYILFGFRLSAVGGLSNTFRLNIREDRDLNPVQLGTKRELFLWAVASPLIGI